MNIVDKIKALLAKAASTDNQAEAELFLAKAHELMEKHQLDAGDLEKDDPIAFEGYYQKGSTKAAPDWDFMLIFNVARYFGCKAIRTEKYIGGGKAQWVMDMVGRESARVTAKEMHAYLVATVRRLGRQAAEAKEFPILEEYDGRYYKTGKFMNADQCARRIGNALRSRLGELASEMEAKSKAPTATGRNALVTVDRVLAIYNEKYPNSAPIRGTFSTTGKAREIAAGIGLNNQVGGSSTLRLGGK
jgi:hypothetical protein